MNRTFTRFFLVLAASGVLGGCNPEVVLPSDAAPVAPAAATLSPGKSAEVVIYHQDRWIGGGASPTVRLNGVDLVSVRGGRVFRTRLAPGHYIFDLGSRSGAGADIEAKAGDKYYFSITFQRGSNNPLNLVAPQQGAFESAGLKPVAPNNIEAPAFR